MRSSIAFGLIAGVTAERPLPEVPELEAIGEETAPRRRAMPWHQHEGWELYLQISGTTARASRELTIDLQPGQAFLSAPQSPHRVVNRGSDSHHSAHVRFALAPVLARHPQLEPWWRARGCLHLPHASSLIEPVERLLREVATEQALRASGVRIALDALVIAAGRIIAGAPARIIAPLPPGLERARRLIDEQCGEHWSLARLSQAAAMSASHLLALFRRHLGMPPHRYLIVRRIERARHLLSFTDLSVRDIASQLGYATSQHFAASFHAHAGTSARAFRRQRLLRCGADDQRPVG